MKNVIIFAVMAILGLASLSCNGQSTSTNKKNDGTTKEKKTKTIKLNKANFLTRIIDYETTLDEWNYLGDKPAIIDFYADWCAPCRMIVPMMEELAEEYSGKIYVYKIDIEEEQELAALFGVRTIPFFLFIPMDGEPQAARGALSKDVFKKAIEEVLLK